MLQTKKPTKRKHVSSVHFRVLAIKSLECSTLKNNMEQLHTCLHRQHTETNYIVAHSQTADARSATMCGVLWRLQTRWPMNCCWALEGPTSRDSNPLPGSTLPDSAPMQFSPRSRPRLGSSQHPGCFQPSALTIPHLPQLQVHSSPITLRCPSGIICSSPCSCCYFEPGRGG